MSHAKRKLANVADRHVRLHHWLMRTEAWRSLDCVGRCAYIEIASRYGGPGTNNGAIPCSVREMALALNVSKPTAMRAFKRLQERGFIVETKRGTFSQKVRHSTEWRLSEFGCDRSGGMATKDFARWTEKQKTVSPRYPHDANHETVRVAA